LRLEIVKDSNFETHFPARMSDIAWKQDADQY
jgi:hypothetical protein